MPSRIVVVARNGREIGRYDFNRALKLCASGELAGCQFRESHSNHWRDLTHALEESIERAREEESNQSRSRWRYFGWFLLVVGIDGAIMTPESLAPNIGMRFRVICGLVALVGVWLISRGPERKI